MQRDFTACDADDADAVDWPPIRRVGIVVKPRLDGGPRVVRDLIAWLKARDIEPVLDEACAAMEGSGSHRTVTAEALPSEVDLIVVLGGDGTLLATARRIALAGADVAVLARELRQPRVPHRDDAAGALRRARAGRRRHRRGRDADRCCRCGSSRDGAVRHETPVLNDVVVNRGPLSRMTDLSVHVDDLFVARFKADGLIVATATGSTAYNLSAGGPIVHPYVDAIVLTPIAPHTLTNRPVVLPATAALTIQPIIAGGEDIFVTADGQTGYPLSAADTVTVTRADARPAPRALDGTLLLRRPAAETEMGRAVASHAPGAASRRVLPMVCPNAPRTTFHFLPARR